MSEQEFTTSPNDRSATQTGAQDSGQVNKVYLDRAEILAVEDVQVEAIRIPEWEKPKGPQVWLHVRGLSGKERDSYEASITVRRGRTEEINLKNARAKLVVRCVVDLDGNRMFTDADVAALGEKSASALQRIFDTCRRLSGLTDDDINELTENFD